MTAPEGPAVVVGQLGRHLVLDIDRLARGGRSTAVHGRREVLGGAGAVQAVALARLGCPVAPIGVLGNDPTGDLLLAQAVEAGLWVSGIARRQAPTALLVDLVEPGGARRRLVDVPDPTLLGQRDVQAASPLLARARAVLVQLAQPGEVVRAALAATPRETVRVADGAPPDGRTRAALLDAVHVLCADAAEAGLWVDGELHGLGDVRAAARELCAAGPRVVSVAAGHDGVLTVWRDPGGRVREELVPGPDLDLVEPDGAREAAVAALTVALLRGADPGTAAQEAAAAAAPAAARPHRRRAPDAVEVAAAVEEHQTQAGRHAPR